MKPLSPKNILNALLFPILLLPVTALFIISGAPGISGPLLATLLYIILLVWVLTAALQTYDLYYDVEFLYMKSLVRKLKIPLSEIKKIHRSHEGIRIKGLTNWRYTISFHPHAKIADQSVYELTGTKKIEEFAAIVKQQNASVLFIDL